MKLRGLQWVSFGLSCLFLIGSCQSNLSDPRKAYPTAAAVFSGAPDGQSANLAMLEYGRKIYTTRCTECHVARTIANYTVPQWRHYLGLMAPRARLVPDERVAL